MRSPDNAEAQAERIASLIFMAGRGAITGTRFLSLPGGGTAVRTGSGSDYSFETPERPE